MINIPNLAKFINLSFVFAPGNDDRQKSFQILEENPYSAFYLMYQEALKKEPNIDLDSFKTGLLLGVSAACASDDKKFLEFIKVLETMKEK